MPLSEHACLWDYISKCFDGVSERWLRAGGRDVNLEALRYGSGLGDGLDRLRGASLLLWTEDQLTAAQAMIELDGTARRMVLCPPDLPEKHLGYVMATAGADTVVCEQGRTQSHGCNPRATVEYDPDCARRAPKRFASEKTEWILLTSGTTGVPKLVVHTLSTLTGAIRAGEASTGSPIWGTFYDIRRYGGLQIFLRAMLGPGAIVLSSKRETSGEFLVRAGIEGITHISGTPSHWRGALMSGSAERMSPRYVRLSGEIADQTILDSLGAAYPQAEIAHAFASTEAGVAFDVRDGLAGFPASLLDDEGNEVKIRVADGSLRIRSDRNAIRYLGEKVEALVGPDGFIDTGDMVETRNGRCYFVGRRSGVINVGGWKVHPEEIEAVINRHPRVRMSLVKARTNPITGAVVIADVVTKTSSCTNLSEPDAASVKEEILAACRSELPRYKVPAIIRLVPYLQLSGAGKLARLDA